MSVRRPACMDQQEFADWSALNELAKWGKASSPCADCLPVFAQQMRELDSCDGTPGEDAPRRRGPVRAELLSASRSAQASRDYRARRRLGLGLMSPEERSARIRAGLERARARTSVERAA